MGRRRELEAELRDAVRARVSHLLGDSGLSGGSAATEDTVPRRSLTPPRIDSDALVEDTADPATDDRVDDWEEFNPVAPVPPAAPPARAAPTQFGRVHVTVVVGLLLIGLLGAGWGVLRARPVALATPVDQRTSLPSVAATPPSSPGTRPLPANTASAPDRDIVVHVVGAVRRPGVVSLPAQARVLDAIEAAGGLRSGADAGQLNLAQVLADGAQLVIGTKATPQGEVRSGGSAAPPGAGGPLTSTARAVVDLNVATEAELQTLPGVGPVTAAKIVAWRAEHGRFTRIEELQEVDGIGPKTFAELAPHLRV